MIQYCISNNNSINFILTEKMGRATPLVMRLVAVSLVALVIFIEEASGSSDTTTLSPQPHRPTQPMQKTVRPDRGKQRGPRRRTSTTTTTTVEPEDLDVEELGEKTTTPPTTTTVDPRSFDHSKYN